MWKDIAAIKKVFVRQYNLSHDFHARDYQEIAKKHQLEDPQEQFTPWVPGLKAFDPSYSSLPQNFLRWLQDLGKVPQSSGESELIHFHCKGESVADDVCSIKLIQKDFFKKKAVPEDDYSK